MDLPGTTPAEVPIGPGTPKPAPTLADLEKLYAPAPAPAPKPQASKTAAAPSLDELERQYAAPAGSVGNIDLGSDQPKKNTPSVSPQGTDQGTGFVDQVKELGRNLTTEAGLKKVGMGIYHGVVDPVATAATELAGPGQMEAQEIYDKAHPDQSQWTPKVASDPVGRIAAPLVVAASLLPIGEAAGMAAKAGLAKVAPSAAARVAELLTGGGAASTAARVAAGSAKSAVHGAAIGAASDPAHPVTGAEVGAAAGAIIHPVATAASSLVRDVAEAHVQADNAAELARRDAELNRRRTTTNYYPEENPARILPSKAGAAPPPPAPKVSVVPDVAQGPAPADFEVEQNAAPPAPPAPAPAPPAPATMPPQKLLGPGQPGTPTEAPAGVQLPPDDAISYMDDRIRTLLNQRDSAVRDKDMDVLTGLPNQGAWTRALPNAEAHPRMSIVRGDINGMKNAQDAVGSHAEGDKIIQSAAQAMKQAAAGIQGARVFRVGGDEFGAIVPTEHAPAFQQAAELAYGLKDHGQGSRTSLSLGIGNTDAEADQATYQRKASQKPAQGIGDRAPAPAPAPPPETPALPPGSSSEAAKPAEAVTAQAPAGKLPATPKAGPTLDALEKLFAPQPTTDQEKLALEPRKDLEREHTQLQAELKKPKLSKMDRRTAIQQIDYVRKQLRAHGVELAPMKHEQPATLAPKGPPALPADIAKKPKLSEDQLEHDARYPDGERFRPYHTVSTDGLVEELANLQDRIAARQGQTELRTADERGTAIQVTTKSRGGRPSVQSQARKNIADWNNRIHQITEHLKQARGLSQEEIDELNMQAHVDRMDRANQQADDLDNIPFEKAPEYDAGAPERVQQAAVRFKGQVVTGPTHYHALVRALEEAGHDVPNRDDIWGQIQERDHGFVTSRGRFVGRQEAHEIADAADQFEDPGAADNRILYAEDLKGFVGESARKFGRHHNALEGTKVVDEKGEPRVVYHGTPQAFRSFRTARSGDDGLFGPGYYHAEHPAHAGEYSGDPEYGTPNIRPARLAIKNPLDGEREYPVEELRSILAKMIDAMPSQSPKIEGLRELDREIYGMGQPVDGEHFYMKLVHAFGKPSDPRMKGLVNMALQDAGFDGITWVTETEGHDEDGSNRYGQPQPEHDRAWMAFKRSQIRSAFGPPEAAGQVGESGAHYQAQLVQRASKLEPPVREQLSLTFGSPEKGLAAADRVRAMVGDLATVTYETPEPGVPPTVAQRKANVGKALKRRDALFASFEPIGKFAPNAHAVAKLFRVGRDPTMEHLQVGGLDDDDRIVHYERWSSGAINYVYPPLGWAGELHERLTKLGATKLVLGHNHPSGDPRPSTGDMRFTQSLAEQFREIAQERGEKPIEVLCHVVIDHTKFSVIRPGSQPAKINEAFPDGIQGYADSTLEELPRESVEASDWTDAHAPGAMSQPEVVQARMAAQVRRSDGFDVLHVDSQNRIVADQFYPASMIDQDGLLERVAADSKAIGAMSQIVVVHAQSEIDRAAWHKLTERFQLANRENKAAALDVMMMHPGGYRSAGEGGRFDRAPGERGAVRATQFAEPQPQFGMFGDEPAAAPSKKDQLGMFGDLEGTKLAQDEAVKLKNKDEKIGTGELEQRRDELGAPKPAQPIATGPDQGALFERGAESGASRVTALTKINELKRLGLDDLVRPYVERLRDEHPNGMPRVLAETAADDILAHMAALEQHGRSEQDAAAFVRAHAAELSDVGMSPMLERAAVPVDLAAIAHDVNGRLRRAASAPRDDADADSDGDMVREVGPGFGASFNRAFNPVAAGDQAAKAGRIIRQETGRHAREIERATEAAKAARQYFEKLPRQERLAFIDRMERGQAQPTPEQQVMADAFRQALDSARTAIQGLGTGKLQGFIDNYFPHIWKDPKKAGVFFGKRPLEGSKSFLKQRSIPTIAAGVAGGLEPESTNPAELVVLKLREMHKYIMATRILQELERQGLTKRVSTRARAPEGWTLINDPSAIKYGPPKVQVAHSEAFDADLRDQLVDAIGKLRIRHSRGVSDPSGKRTAWGWAEQSTARRMWTKLGGGPDVIVHELGHMIDYDHGLWEQLVTPVGHRTTKAGKKVSSDSPEVKAQRKKMILQLRALADARTKGPTGPGYKAYIRNRREQIANAVHALLFAPELGEQLAPDIMAKLRGYFSGDPALKPLLELKRGVRLGTASEVKEYDTGGIVVLSKMHAPDAVARVINNYLSPGLRGSPFYNAYMGVGNVLNAAQLGFSAFHLGFTSLDAAVSKFALALEQAIAGRPVSALKSVAMVPTAPITNIMQGSRVMREYLRPGTVGGDFAAMADAVAQAGGRVRMDEWYRAGHWRAMKTAMVETIRGVGAKHRTGAAIEAAARALPAALELAARPILEYLVPRQKLGVFADLARHELDLLARKYPGGADEDAVRAALQRAWDTVDNRMGQMVYDNLFWNKIGKDLAHAGMRSVGWNVGTLREVGGGLVDTGRAVRKLAPGGRNGGRSGGQGGGQGGAQGDPTAAHTFTHRMAYIVALPLTVGLYGAIVQYLYTGEPPRELKDLYYPRTGGLTPEGDEARIELPSYMKDILGFVRHPVNTVLHKTAPLLNLIASMLQNEDYYGNEIQDPNAAPWKRIEQSLSAIGKEFLPFSVQGALEQRTRGATGAKQVLPLVGLTPAPKEVTRTDAQQAAFEVAQRKRQGIMTPDEAEESRKRYDLEERERKGEDIRGDLERMVHDGEISRADAKRIRAAGHKTSEIRRFQGLSLEQATEVFSQATPAEKRVLGPILAKKRATARKRHAVKAGQ